MKHCTFLLVLGATLLSGVVRAQVPQLVNYQGRVAVDSVNFEGAGQFKFALVNSDGTVTFWSNDGTSFGGSEPTAAVTLTVAKGLYSVLLGDTVLGNMTAIPASAFTNSDVRLRVWFNDGVNGSQLLTPDQRLAPATYLADGAVTTAAIAAGAVNGTSVAPGSLNGTNIAAGSLDFSLLNVPAAPGPGQVLGFDGNTLNWVAPGGSPSVWSLNGSSAYYNSGNVGVGTATPAAKLEVSSNNGNTLLYATAPLPNLIFRDTNASNARSVMGGNAGGFRFYTESFWNGTNPFAYMALDNGGRLGIGTASPLSSLHIAAVDAVRLTGNRPYLTLEDTSTGLYSRIEGDGAGLNFKTQGAITGSNPSGLLHLDGGGNVGIGTTNPQTKLEVHTGAGSYGMMHSDGSIKLASYIGGSSSGASGGWFGTFSNDPLHFFTNNGQPSLTVGINGNVGIGTTAPVAKLHAETSQVQTAAVYGKATGNGGIGVYGKSDAGPAVYAEGNATQARDKGGFVKAMAFIDPFLPANQYVVRCYNSQQAGGAVSTPPCGITVTRLSEGWYKIDFGFYLQDRFLNLTPDGMGATAAITSAHIDSFNNNVYVSMWDPLGHSLESRFFITLY